ncbi:MAG: glycosyltransferase family 2 protein [Candidatus Margulisiibacteriota bacterium]
MKISFIMPVKNVGAFVEDAISGILSQPLDNWELIIVDDSSTDNTYSILEAHSRKDPRIKTVKNPHKGKVQGLNYGYSLSKGDYIKCIDGDDVLMQDFGTEIDRFLAYDAAYHDFEVDNKDLVKISSARMGGSMAEAGFEECFKEMKSVPRCLWSFKRSVADKIFPMPEELPFEDVWFSLVIKKHASKIGYIKRSLYKYRQHGSQTFGGYLNFSKDIVIFRANRMLKLLEVIGSDSERRFGEPKEKLANIIKFYDLLADGGLSFSKIAFSGLGAGKIMKLLLLRKFNPAAATALRIKNVVRR